MTKLSELRTTKNETRRLIITALFLAGAIVSQLIGRFNPDLSRVFVGPVINMLTVLTAYYCGKKYGILFAILTPILAFFLGQLNPVMAPFIPFILIANIAYILVFMFVSETMIKRIFSLTIGSLLKYGVFILAIKYGLNIFNITLPKKLLTALPYTMGTMQLIAAASGAVLAIVVIEILKMRLKNNKSYTVKE